MSFIKRFFPILVVIAFMTFFTFQSTEATMKVSDGVQIFVKSIYSGVPARWNYDKHWVRSLLHIPLYFVLGSVVCATLHHARKSLVICTIVAIADETIKIFLPTLEFEGRDIAIDAIGFVIGIGIVSLINGIIELSKRQVE